MRSAENLREEVRTRGAASVELLWAILNSSTDCLLIAALDGRISGANDSAMRFLGYSRTELFGKTLVELLDIPRNATLKADNLATVPLGDRWSGSCRIAMGTGATMKATVTVRRITENNATITMTHGCDQARVTPAGGRTDDFVEQYPYPVLSFNADGVILYANSASRPLLKKWRTSVGEPAPSFWRERADLALRRGSTQLAETTFGRHTYSIAFTPDSEKRRVNLYGFDVTALRRAEITLRKRAEQYRSLVDQASDGIFVSKSDGSRLEVNAAGRSMLGYSSAELRRMNLTDLYLKDDLATSPVRIDDVLAGKTIWQERRLRRKDGSTVSVEITARMLSDRRLQGIVRDMSERKRAEAELSKERDKLALIAETLPGMLCQLTRERDETLRIRFASAKAHEITGFHTRELLERSSAMWDLVHPDDQGVVYALIEESERFLIPCTYQFRYRHPTKGEIWLQGQTVPRRDPAGSIVWYGFFADVSDRILAVDILRENEEKYRALFLGSRDAVLLSSADGSIQAANPAACRMFGRTESEICGIGREGLVDDSDRRLTMLLDERRKTGAAAGELTMLRRDGTRFPAELSSSVFLDSHGRRHTSLIVRDITERKVAEDLLRRSEQKFATLFHKASLPSALARVRDFAIVDVNEAWEEMFGYPREQTIGKTPVELGISRSSETVFSAMDKLKTAGAVPAFEELLFSKSGEGYTVLTSIRVIEIDGEDYAVTSFQDITQRKRAEENIRRLNRTYAVLSNINKLIARERNVQRLYDETCRIATEDGEFLNTWIGLIDRGLGIVRPVASAGVAADYGRNVTIDLSVGNGEHGPTGRAILSGNVAVSQDIEHDLHMAPWKEVALSHGFKSSGAFPLRVADAIIGSINFYSKDIGFFDQEEVRLLEELAMHISFALKSLEVEQERVRAEKSLMDSERKYRVLAESSPEMIYVVRRDGRLTYVNASATVPFGIGADELVGKHLSEVLTPEMAQENLANIRSVVESGLPRTRESLQRFRSGERWIETRLSPVRDEEGTISSVLGLSIDITNRKKSEETLVRLRSAVHASGEVIFMTDRRGVFSFVNNAFTDLYGYSAEEVVGKATPRILKSDRISEQEYTLFWTSLLAGQTVKREWVNRTRDSKLPIIDITANPILDSQGSVVGFLAIQRDVTGQRNLEEQFRQSQKMESLGTLASGIAHDFNNILTIILGHVSIIELYKDDPDRLLSGIKNINIAAWRGASLVRQMLTFARKTDTEFKPLVINDAAREVERLLSETFPKTIRTVFALGDHLPLIFADGTQIHQVLLNLCVNARDAMGERGTLTVSTRLVDGDLIRPQYIAAHSDEYLEVRVSDTGAGMDKVTIGRIFEPFFTTKERTKGSGLGLAVVFGIVRAHNGFIDVESQPGKGSTFRLYFPAYEEQTGNAEGRTRTPTPIARGSETILLVDDEESLRESARAILKSNGYTVLTEGDGSDAVREFQARAGDIDLVICDYGLTGLNGLEVFRKIRAIDSNVRFMLVSGFVDPGEKASFLMKERVEFLQKPYGANDLLTSTRRTLDWERRN